MRDAGLFESVSMQLGELAWNVDCPPVGDAEASLR
jgi:hypothetical protein